MAYIYTNQIAIGTTTHKSERHIHTDGYQVVVCDGSCVTTYHEFVNDITGEASLESMNNGDTATNGGFVGQ